MPDTTTNVKILKNTWKMYVSDTDKMLTAIIVDIPPCQTASPIVSTVFSARVSPSPSVVKNV